MPLPGSGQSGNGSSAKTIRPGAIFDSNASAAFLNIATILVFPEITCEFSMEYR
jgi:hypothetical protein